MVFDFDYTILKIHAFHLRIREYHVEERWERDFADLEVLRLVADLCHSKGISLGVASFGEVSLIRAYFSYAQLEHHFPLSHLIGRNSKNFPAKHEMIRELMEQVERENPGLKLEPHQVVLFDDDPLNIDSCSFAGFKAVLCPPDKPSGPGLTRSFWNTFTLPHSVH